MLPIGEFSKICKVSTKTLRYYEEIDLLKPREINKQNGYRYYCIRQVEDMLLINRLKSYYFSLEEIKLLILEKENFDEKLYIQLQEKRNLCQNQLQAYQNTIQSIDEDIEILRSGKSILSYLDNIDVQLVETPTMNLLYIRKMVTKDEFVSAYKSYFKQLLKNINENNLTQIGHPMVLFHSDEFSPFGLDTEFAIPINELVKGTRDFTPGLCLKTTLKGSYLSLPSIYAKQCEWAETNSYVNTDALFEIYINDPSTVSSEDELITEVYYPVKKK